MKNSLRSRLFVYFLISMVIIIFSMGFALLNSLNLQHIADRRFEDEQFLQELQFNLDDIQEPLNTYLTSYSSSSLATLLFIIETLNEVVPNQRPVTSSNSDLIKREIYFLIDSYLIKLNEVIEQKRGRKVQQYINSYSDLNVLYNYISSKINDASLLGFRIQLAEYRRFLELFRKMQLYGILQILLATAFAFSILMRTLNNIANPMYQLSLMAAKLSKGNFDIPDIHFNSVTEVNQVAEAFNDMKLNIRHYVDELHKQKEIEQQVLTEKYRNLEMEQLLKRMELYTMQAQMNPHFLFNTINTGVQLAIMEDADRTAEYMENLAALFRYNIREKQFFVPLRHELEGLKSYYNILKIRFPKTLKLILNVQDDIVDNFTCPSMIIQPLVENSVLHAFKKKEGLGTITVSVSYIDPVLLISVRDDGSGIAKDTVRELLTPHTHDYKLNSRMMGLENVIQRCYFFYPDQKDVIDIKSSQAIGTEIQIRIHTEVKHV
ncbi:MAG: two-component sensor histidine kinase [Spirochaetes bacterium]|nr:MAG: two-component sensor histidine kinase [Spirochaetota bacterium]